MNFSKFLYKTASLCTLGLLLSSELSAQVTTNGGSGLAATYPSLAAAITALNGATISSPVLIALTGAETAPAGGYSITAQGTAANGITITGSSSTITASNAHTAGALNDAVFKLVGADFITLQNFTMQENAANTTTAAATNNMTEWGVALLYATTTNGSQNNTIQGNTISLNRTYTNTFGIYSNVRHSPTIIGTTADITAATGSNSNNKVYGNNISNVGMGITFIGSGTAANQDANNDIGGASSATGNIITNFGGAAATSGYISNSGTSYGVFMNHQTVSNVSNNTITSASVSGTAVTFRGILQDFTTTAPTGTFTNTISNNRITLTSGFTSGTFQHIAVVSGAATVTLNINGNLMVNSAVTGASSSSTMVGISNGSTVGTLNINSNTIRGWTSTATSGGFTGITNTGAVVNTININNNIIGDATPAITFSAATSGAILGLNNTGGASTAALSFSGNDFRGLVQNSIGSNTHTYIANSAATLSQNFSNNTFTNLIANTTGSVTFMSNDVALPTGGSVTVSSNSIVTGFNKLGAGGTVTLFFTSTTPSSPTGTTKNHLNNNFSNITLTGATTMAGWTDLEGATGGGSTKIITNNTFSNWNCGSSAVNALRTNFSGNNTNIANNTFSNITATGAITVVSVGGSNGGATQNVRNNTISNIISNAPGGALVGITAGSASITTLNITNNTLLGLYSVGTSVNGIVVSAGATTNVLNNKIGDLQANNTAGTINGLLVSAGTTNNIANNIIGDLKTPITTSTTDAIRGINLTSTTTTSNINVYYNTVYLAAASTGTNFSTAAIFHTTSAAATTAALDMRNNIFVNNSTANGIGNTVAYRRSNATLTNFAATSNNNDFFAPIIFADGTVTNATLATYQATVTPREANSISVAPNFTSIAANNSGFLHINPNIATPLESAGANIAGITDDFDGDIRQGNAGYTGTGTAPDMGADEVEIVITNCSGTPVAAVASPATGVYCSGANPTHTMSATVPVATTGINYQWQVSNTMGGPYSNVVGGSASTVTSYTSGVLTAGVYYYVLRTNCSASGLSSVSNEIAVTVTASPTITVNPSTANFCTPGGAPVALTAAGATTYSWSPAAGLSATTGTSVAASPATTTSYTVTGTTNGCTNTATVTVSVLPGVNLSAITATPTSVGFGGSSQLAVTASTAFDPTVRSYSFSASSGTYTAITGTSLTLASQDDSGIGNLPIGFTFNYNGATHTVFGARTNGLIELSQTGAALTGASANALATTANCIAPLWDDNNMTGGTIIYATTGAAPNRVLTVQWTGMHVGSTGNATNPTIDAQVRLYETTGVVEIMYGSTSAALSVTTASIGISGAVGNFRSVTPLLPVNTSTTSTVTENSAINSATNFPSGTIYTFTPPVVPVITYAWSPATFLNSTTIANPLASNVTVTTPYTVTATAPNGCFATSNTTLTMVLAFTAQASITSPSVVCEGAALNLSATPSGGNSPFTYAWSGPNGFSSTLQTPSITNLTAAASGQYSVTITDAGSATATASTASLTVNAVPSLTITQSSTTYCNPGSGVSITAAGAASYAWSPAASLSAANIANPVATPAATTVYSVTGTSANSCTSVANVTVISAPAVVLNPITATPASVCLNGSSQLTVSSPTAIYNVATASFSIETPSATATTVTLSSTDEGVSTTALPIPFTFTYFGMPYNSLFAFTNGFVELGGNLSSTSQYGAVIPNTANPNNIIAGVWDDLNVTGAGANIRYFTNGTTPNRVFVVEYNNVKFFNGFSNNGNLTFQIKLFETSNRVEIHIQDATDPTPSNHFIGIENVGGTLGAAPAGRNPFTTNLTNEAWSFTPSTPTYAWSPATFLNSTTIANPLASNITITTPYTVTATLGACSATANVTITAGAPLTLSTTITPTAICVGGTVSLGSTPAGGGAPYTYSWSGPNGFSSTVQNPSFTATTVAASGIYTLTVSDLCGASVASSTAALTVNALPALTVTPANAVYCVPGTGIQLTAAGAASYSWTPAATLSASNIANPMATPTVATIYTVVATGANGCTISGTSSISVSNSPSLAAITATPATVCAGANSQLTTNATVASDALAAAYSFTATSGTFTTITGTASTLALGDDVTEGNLPIGFTFNYNGAAHTTFAINSNGAIQLSSAGFGTGAVGRTNNLATSASRNVLAPLWDDNNTTDGTVVYATTGTAPNRVLTVQWLGMAVGDGGFGIPEIDMQVRLYEANGVVEFVYGNTTAPFAFTTASIGISGANNNFRSVTPLLPVNTSTSSNTVENSTISSATNFPSGTIYRFTPPTPAFTYNWSPATFLNNSTIANPSVTGITSNTTYTVTATTPAGCFATATTSISVTSVTGSAAVTSNYNGAQISCFGSANGQATATASGGAAPYTFVWSNGQTGATATGLAAGVYITTYTDASGCSGTASVTLTQPSAVTATITSQTNVLCNGAATGSATVAATGGTGGYTFVWSPGFQTTATATGLAAGIYFPTCTDVNGCVATSSVTITQPTALTATNTPTNITCFGANNGIITVNATGGTGTYSFNRGTGAQGSNVFNGLAVGSYTITVTDANGCSITTAANITQPAAALALTVTATGAGCGGSIGSATATTTGGTAGYSFLWTGNRTGATITGLTAGAYAVTVTDANGCSITGNANVTATVSPVTITASQTEVLCFGGNTGAINATPANGATPYTFAWSNGSTVSNNTGLVANTYTLTVTDANSCMAMASYTISQPAAALAASSTQTNVSCFGGNNGTITASATGGTAPYMFMWAGGITTAARTGLAAGTYTVTVTDFNGCMTMTSATITQPAAALTASTTATTVSCFGGNDGTATVTSAGGTGAVMFMWSNTQTTATATGLVANAYTVTATDANGCTTTATTTVTQPAAALTTTPASTTPSCIGDVDGMIMANATGGTAPYMYMWSNTQTTATTTGLAAGVYQLTVTDSRACVTNATITLSDPAAISLTLNSADVLCNGGTTGMAMATTAGGTGAFTYTWSNGETSATATGLMAGVYTIAVRDANGCSETGSVTISEPTAIGINTSSTDATACGAADGTGLVVATGGTTPYTYAWSNGQTTDNLSSVGFGVYTITVTDDNGCMKDGAVTIGEPSGVSVTATVTDVLCFNTNTGTSTAVAAGGIAPYMYAWSDGQMTDVATGLIAGAYSVTATDDAGCRAFTNVTITEATPITLSVSSTDATCGTCTDGSAMAQVLGGVAPYTFAWSNGATSALNIGLAVGAYTVTITDANGCTTNSSVTVSLFVSVDNNTVEAVKLYPNPTTATITIENLPVNARVQVINSLGQTLRSYEPNQPIMQMDMTEFSPATYYIQIIADKRAQIIPVVRIR